MVDQSVPRARYGEAFWRAHHEAWKRSVLNQREYCESQGISLKAFGNWRAKFKAEPEAPQRKLLNRRGGASHSLSHTLSHSLSHMTYPSSAPAQGPIVLPARPDHRPRFSDADRRHILAEAAQTRRQRIRGREALRYLRDVLQSMVDGHSINRLDDLLPWSWKSKPVNP